MDQSLKNSHNASLSFLTYDTATTAHLKRDHGESENSLTRDLVQAESGCGYGTGCESQRAIYSALRARLPQPAQLGGCK